ncbi:DUF2442 domain-containing protein [Deltaproteobacteria bacterium TL4]
MKKIHDVEKVAFTTDNLLLKVNGEEHCYLLADISKKLLNASETERNQYRVMASGYGIHWSLLDEDLSIDGLLGIRHTPPIQLRQQQA